MRRSTLVNAIALLAIVALALWYADHVPRVVPASAPATEFSAERAMAHVREIAQRPHPTGSVDHARVLQYITTQTASLGIATSVQETVGVGTRYPVAGRVRNILARISGRQPGPAVLLMAHYDGVPAAPAAADDGAGSAVLLETLRALRAGGELRHDVIALFTDSEESGLLGAAAFAREHPWARDVGVILNFEARGTSGPSMMFETGAGDADVVSVLRTVAGARATSLSTAVYRALPNDTDLSEMMVLGAPAMNFAFIGGVERYHTSEDDLAHLSPGSVQHHGNQALALARRFASEPLPRPRSADAVFFDFPLLGIVAYPEWLAVVVGVLTLALVVAAVVQVRRAGAAIGKDAVLGAAAFLVSLCVACGVAFGLATLLASIHAGLEHGGAPQWRGIYAAATTLLVAALVLGTYALARRVASARGLGLGALMLVSGIALIVAIVAPGVSFLFTWPAFFAASAAVGALVVRSELIALLKDWIAAMVTLFLMVPTIYLMVCVALGLDSVGAVALGALTCTSLWLLAPRMEAMAGGHPWRPVMVLGSVSLLLVAIGLATVRTDARRPAGAVLVYAIDADSQSAWFAGTATTRGAREWIARSAAALPPPTQGAAAPRWLSRMFAPERIAPLPFMPTTQPEASVVRDSLGPSHRVVTLNVRGGAGAGSVLVTAASGVLTSMRVEGRVVDRSGLRSRGSGMSLEYVSPPDTGFILELTMPSGSPGVLALMSRHVRQGTPPEVAMPARPVGILPFHSGDVTYVYRMVHLPMAGRSPRR